METPDSILRFWFGTHSDDKTVAEERAKLWWQKHHDTDRQIRERFEPWVARAKQGELDAWAAAPTGCLALIILTDQFPRNMYRNTPQAFAYDPLALSRCKEGLRRRLDETLRPIQRVFFYLPLEHSETMEDQEQSVALFRQLVDEVDAKQKPIFDDYLDYAIRHHDVIRRFGRYPHRNRMLGRQSTPEELTFLSEKRSSF